jgi:hypothetical protein
MQPDGEQGNGKFIGVQDIPYILGKPEQRELAHHSDMIPLHISWREGSWRRTVF